MKVSWVAIRFKVLARSIQGVCKCYFRCWQSPFKVLRNSTESVSKLNARCQQTLFKMYANSTQGVCKLHSRCFKCHSRGSEAQFKVPANSNQGVRKLQVLKLSFYYIPWKSKLIASSTKTDMTYTFWNIHMKLLKLNALARHLCSYMWLLQTVVRKQLR